MKLTKDLKLLQATLTEKGVPSLIGNLGGDIPGITFIGRDEFITQRDDDSFYLGVGADDETLERKWTAEEVLAEVISWPLYQTQAVEYNDCFYSDKPPKSILYEGLSLRQAEETMHSFAETETETAIVVVRTEKGWELYREL